MLGFFACHLNSNTALIFDMDWAQANILQVGSGLTGRPSLNMGSCGSGWADLHLVRVEVI